MKKQLIILVSIGLLVVSGVRGQFVVTDVMNTFFSGTNMAQTLETMYSTYDQLDKMADAAKKLQEVNSKIKQGKMVLEIGKNIKDITKMVGNLPGELKKIEDPEVRKVAEDVVQSRLDEFKVFKDVFNGSIKSDFFEGSDMDRITVLTDVYEKSLKLKGSVGYMSMRVKSCQ